MVVDVRRYLKKVGPLYSALSALHVYWHRNSQLCEVPIDICVNPMGFSFAPGGWNYLIEQLKEFDRGREPDTADSVLHKFHNRYQPDDMSDIPASAGFDVAFKPSLSIYPWGPFNVEKDGSMGVAKDALTSRFYGPSTEALVEKDLRNLQGLYTSIKAHGYRPWRYRNAFIGGVFLEREDGRRRYVVLQGNHRTAILAHLGHKQILTRYLKGHHRCIREKDVGKWSYVESGECHVEDALAYIKAFFQLDGTERAKAMGFLE